jgi:hypothetical protein
MVCGAWFSRHLLLEGTGSYPNFLGRNRWPVVPGVQDPDTIHKINIIIHIEIMVICDDMNLEFDMVRVCN